MGGGSIKLGAKVKFHQKLYLYGNGFIRIGDNCEFGYEIGGRFHNGCIEIQTRENNAIINIGNNVLANNNLMIVARGNITIGDNCLIGKNVDIMDHNAHGVNPQERRTSPGTVKDVLIGRNVWIGNNVTILPGTHIGDNSIVGVGSVVKGIYPDNVIIQGNLGKVVKHINVK